MMISLFLREKQKHLLFGVAVLAAGGCLFLGHWLWTGSSLHSKSQESPFPASNQTAQEVIPVRAFQCESVAFVDTLTLTGHLQGGGRVDLRFEREGRIEKMFAYIGKKVKKGDVIAQLETSESRLRLEQAEAELSQAVDLYKAGAIAKPRLTQARLSAELGRADFNRSYLRAPRNGSIGELNAEAGEHVTPQMTVATLVSLERIIVEMGVIEKDLNKMKQQQTVLVQVESYPGVSFKGRVVHIAPMVEGTGRTRLVRAEMNNKEGLLLPGMFAKCRILIAEKANALVIPFASVWVRNEEPHVYRIQSDNTLKATPISVGYEGAEYVEALSGLKKEDVIVASPRETLSEGQLVEVVEQVAYESH